MVAYRGAFRTWLNIYNWAFFVKIPNGVKLLTISARKAPSYMFDWVENRFLAKSFTYCLFPTYKLNRQILSQEICVTSFLKRSCWDSKQSQCLCRSSRPKGSLKKVLWEISQNSQENICAGISFWFFLVNFAKFARTPVLQNSTGRLLLIIAVSIVAKRVLPNETVNSETRTKAYVLIRARSVSY